MTPISRVWIVVSISLLLVMSISFAAVPVGYCSMHNDNDDGSGNSRTWYPKLYLESLVMKEVKISIEILTIVMNDQKTVASKDQVVLNSILKTVSRI